jgi:hypothetical protein
MVKRCVPGHEGNFYSSATAELKVRPEPISDYVLEGVTLVVNERCSATLGQKSAVERDCLKILVIIERVV